MFIGLLVLLGYYFPMENCIFCKIIVKEVPSLTVFEDADTVAFMELNPSAPGHVMTVLKEHGKNILDYDKEALGTLMISVQTVAKKLQKALGCDSISIGINHLERRGVPHLHVHLIPRWENDKGGVMQSLVHNPPQEKREVIAERIRNA